MSGNESIDFSLENIFTSWHKFKIGKTKTNEFHAFQYNLESNLFNLHHQLVTKTYKHGPYRSFEVNDNKKRLITVATVKDRVVHRLLYDYLVTIYDKTFIFDVWSCRQGKGLHKGISRTKLFALNNKNGYFWRADVSKYFNSIDRRKLFQIVTRKIQCQNALWLLSQILNSSTQNGIPIGNLSSQILANIYLNELDHFIKHDLKCKNYIRYGDDFIVFASSKLQLEKIKNETVQFLQTKLKLKLSRIGGIFKVSSRINFLGMVISAYDLRLNNRLMKRLLQRTNYSNLPSYLGIIKSIKRSGLAYLCTKAVS